MTAKPLAASLQTAKQVSIDPSGVFPGHLYTWISQWNKPIAHSLATVHEHLFQRTPGRVVPHHLDTSSSRLVEDKPKLKFFHHPFVAVTLVFFANHSTPLFSGKSIQRHQQPGHYPQGQPPVTEQSQAVRTAAQGRKLIGGEASAAQPMADHIRLFEVLFLAKPAFQPLPRRWIPCLGHQMRKTRIRGGGQGTGTALGMAETGGDVRRMNAMDEELGPACGTSGPDAPFPVTGALPGNESFRSDDFTRGWVDGGTRHSLFSRHSFMHPSVPKIHRISMAPSLRDCVKTSHTVVSS